MIDPCPMSPNMTANKNGKVMTAKRPGLTSWYVAMPYESMIAGKACVNLFVRWNVGGVLFVRGSCKIGGTEVPDSSCPPDPQKKKSASQKTAPTKKRARGGAPPRGGSWCSPGGGSLS